MQIENSLFLRIVSILVAGIFVSSGCTTFQESSTATKSDPPIAYEQQSPDDMNNQAPMIDEDTTHKKKSEESDSLDSGS